MQVWNVCNLDSIRKDKVDWLSKRRQLCAVFCFVLNRATMSLVGRKDK